MVPVLVGCAVVAFVLSLGATGFARKVGDRLAAHDGKGVDGQVKAEVRRVPNTGGIGIATTLLCVLGVTAIAAWLWPDSAADASQLTDLAAGVRENTTLLVSFLAGLFVVHVVGVIDDRKPLPWQPKLFVMLLVPMVVVWVSQTRVLTLFDDHVGGSWLSVLITAFWFAVVMNAMNFLDNMDGLAGGLGAIVSAGLVAISIVNGQWIIGAGSAVLLGACAGFLPHNFPRARVFMGDGGSLVLGFTIAFLTVRLNYADSESGSPQWHLLFVPFVLLAIPLYDFVSVVLLRFSQGKSPFVGDLQHFSHRMARRGLGNRGAVLLVWMLAGMTGTGAVVMSRSEPWQAALIAGQTLAVIGLIAYLERGIPERSS
ncbi:MAG: undecaprenyl/decaprenyl-phosphate alpha-N-acetylglucosaminyl 1-phosphate transferase [Phycisphaera sp.]|nr:MAG: undecaprenyl/decaprenyl-phosphate alpha-N-acetylglucosaminyl 1-phosphate transferase [Phycisphaera sp.]